MFVCSNCGYKIDTDVQFCPHCGVPSDLSVSHGNQLFKEGTNNSPKNGSSIADPDYLQSGYILEKKYEIISKLEYNVACPVYRVYDRTKNIDKALIVIPSFLSENEEIVDILSQELRSKSWLKHPNIISVFKFHRVGPIKFIETEFSAGESLAEIRRNSARKRLSERGVIRIAPRILSALEYAHNQNILHRDLRPQSIMLTPGGVIKIRDFGVSESLRNAVSRVHDTPPRESLLYMSPEQIRGKTLGIHSDIYSFGATIYDLLSGNPPFVKGDIYSQIIHEPAEEIHDISKPMNLILAKCLQKDPAKRYAQCRNLAADINALAKKYRMFDKRRRSVSPLPDPSKKITIQNQAQSRFKKQDKDNLKSRLKFVTKRNSYLKYIGATLIIILAMMSILKVFYNPNLFGEKTRDQAWNDLPVAAKQKIDSLKTQADMYFKNHRLVYPSGENAYELYLQLLTIFPQEKYAWDQIDRIRVDYLQRSNQMKKEKQFFKADSLIKEGLLFFESDSELTALMAENEQSLRDFSQKTVLKIDILNGAGASGLAGRLAYTLANNYDYNINRTDNYIINGLIKWNVPKTKILNRSGENLKIRKLSQLVGAAFESSDLIEQYSTNSNVTIIIGDDYQSLRIFR